VPGLIIAAGLSIVGIIQARRKHFPVKERASWRKRGETFVKAIPMLLMPLFILGGIYGGFFTPTEAAAISCLYAILIGVAVYRGFTWKSFFETISSIMSTVSVLYIMIAGVFLFNYVIKETGLSQTLAMMIVDAQLPPLLLVFGLNAVIVVLGFFVDPWICVMFVPILAPIFVAMNLNLVWVGVLFAIGILAGECTPPMAIVLYITARAGNISAEKIIKGIWPFISVNFSVLILVTLIPKLALWLPELIIGD
jgi:C4-dicarboxylate transporter DctM subunit